MLKVNPEERISAKDALSHGYFQSDSKEEEEQAFQESLDKVESIEESPIITTANEKRRLFKELAKDSCLDFKMAKDNIIIGKTQTVETVGSVKISGFGATLLKGFKPSKFVKPENKENTILNA